MIFREATIADIPQIQTVRHSVKENTLSDRALVTDQDCEAFITQRGKGWVCEIDNRIVGFAIADLKDHNIWALFLHPDFEQKGIGRKLHDTMLDWYFSQTQETVWLGTAPGTRAERFYTKAGWAHAGMHGSKEVKFEMSWNNWKKLNNNSQSLKIVSYTIPAIICYLSMQFYFIIAPIFNINITSEFDNIIGYISIAIKLTAWVSVIFILQAFNEKKWHVFITAFYTLLIALLFILGQSSFDNSIDAAAKTINGLVGISAIISFFFIKSKTIALGFKCLAGAMIATMVTRIVIPPLALQSDNPDLGLYLYIAASFTMVAILFINIKVKQYYLQLSH